MDTIHAADGIASLAHPGMPANDVLIQQLAAAGSTRSRCGTAITRRNSRTTTPRSPSDLVSRIRRVGLPRRWPSPRLPARWSSAPPPLSSPGWKGSWPGRDDRDGPVLEIRGLSKQYSGLRPLRIRELSVGAGERVTIGGLDAGAGEVLVNLVTGASVPDQGEVRVFGRTHRGHCQRRCLAGPPRRFGIVSPRGVLLEGSTLLQNLAMPFTLAIDPVPADVVARVEAVAASAGSSRIAGCRSVREICRPMCGCSRIWRARWLSALTSIVIEHPTAEVAAEARAPLAAAVARACETRRVANLDPDQRRRLRKSRGAET